MTLHALTAIEVVTLSPNGAELNSLLTFLSSQSFLSRPTQCFVLKNRWFPRPVLGCSLELNLMKQNWHAMFVAVNKSSYFVRNCSMTIGLRRKPRILISTVFFWTAHTEEQRRPSFRKHGGHPFWNCNCKFVLQLIYISKSEKRKLINGLILVSHVSLQWCNCTKGNMVAMALTLRVKSMTKWRELAMRNKVPAVQSA